MSIHRTTPKKPEKTLREYSAPNSAFLKQPIEFPNPGVREYRFDGEIIKFCRKKLSVEGKLKTQEDILESSMM